ncbi:MAG: efflux RND transporter periplasmic adaptor subunit [Nannocystaceae bacterium]|nr:efflux RND transporter periplasmic adaptor subunit [bacterium]
MTDSLSPPSTVRPRVVAVVLSAALLSLTSGCDEQESTQLEEKVAPHVRAAEVRLIEPRPRSRHLAPLQAHRRARLSPRTGGQVLVLDADEEQKVEQGKVLVRFAAQDSKGGLISAKASITQIQESLSDAKRELEDANDLVSKGAGTTREVERIETQIATLKAQLSNAKGSLVQAKDRVGAATLQAPFAGTITAVDTEVGEFVAPGVVAVVLAELDPIAVEVPLTQDEVEVYDREGGLSFDVTARETALAAELEYISSESSDGSTFTARLKIDNPGETLRSGELVDVEVYGAAKAQVKAVPFTAVRWSADQAYVLTIGEGRVLERVDVTVIDEADENVIIEGELDAGVRVVETGPTALREGDVVEVVAAPSETLAAG